MKLKIKYIRTANNQSATTTNAKTIQQDWKRWEARAIEVAKQLQQLVQTKDYKSLSEVLDKIVVRENGVLGVEECSHIGMGDESKITITFPDGRVVRNTEDDFWEYISTEDSVLGIWQVYLLKNLWHYLPLFWHANYAKHDYIYTRDQLAIIKTKPAFGDRAIENLDSSQYDVAPRMKFKEDRYIVSACYWSDFGGLIREELPIGLNETGQVVFYEKTGKTLFQYECGILF